MIDASNKYIIYFVIAYRFLCVFLIQGSYHPDELYQSVEPAYRYVYEEGLETWEWSNEYKIRSYGLILLYIIYFYIVRLLHY